MTKIRNMRLMLQTSGVLLAAVGPIIMSAHAGAQNLPAASQEEIPSAAGAQIDIVVTAQRRSERLQDVPISIVALSELKLKEENIRSTADLGQITPGLVINQQGSYTQPRLRGIGTIAISPSIENPVALYVDGVYIGGQAGSTLSLNNITQVEVDKGPQGTLFGRNATGGLIQIATRDPRQQFGWSGSVGYGNYQRHTGDIYITGGVTDTLAADLSLAYAGQGKGYGTNAFDGKDVNKANDLSLRNKWLWTPGDRTKVQISADFERSTGKPVLVTAPGTFAAGGYSYTGPRLGTDSFHSPYSLSKRGGISLKIEQDLEFATLASISALRKSRTHLIYDSLTPDPSFSLYLDKTDTNRQFTQELQLQSQAGAKLKWVAGAFLYDADARYDPIRIILPALFGPGAIGLQYHSSQKSLSGAIYGQVTGKILADTNATIGLRYTSERREVITDQALLLDPVGEVPLGESSARKTYNKLTWRLALDHHFSPDMMGYASYNRGFKSGGFNEIEIPQSSYEPETLDAFEVGLKTALADRKITINASVFYYDYKNIQTVRYQNSSALVYNGSGARLYGLDIDASANFGDRLVLNAGAEFLHATYKSFIGADRTVPLAGGGTAFLNTAEDGSPFDAKGNRVALAPNEMMSASISYRIPLQAGEVNLHASYSYAGGWFAEPDNRLHENGYSLVNGQISFALADTDWKFRIWGRNLTNEHYLVTLGSQDLGDFAAYGAPRTYGVTIEKTF